MKKLYIILPLAFVFLLLYACNGGEQRPRTDQSKRDDRRYDTSDPHSVYQQLVNSDKRDIDTFYHNLYAALSEQNRYKLLLTHMDYYSRLKGGDNQTEAFIEKVRGYAYTNFAKYDSAELFFRGAIRTDSELNLKKELADAYAGLANNYNYKGDHAQAFSYRYKALAIYEQLKDSADIFKARSEMAISLYYQKEYSKAIEIAIASLNYFQSQQDTPMTAYMMTIIATCYYGAGDFIPSLNYSRSSLAIRRELGIKRDIAESLNNISLAYMGLNMWDSATVALSESLDLMRQSNDMRQIPIIGQNLAICLWKTGKTADAIANLNVTIAEATVSGQKDAIANGYKKLYMIYKGTREYDKALENYQRYRTWKDSLFNEETAKTISELNIKYETEKKEKRIGELSLEKKLERARKMAYLAISLLLFLAGTVIIFLLIDRNRKSRLLIDKVKEELKDNKRSLESFTHNIIAKNKFIEELEAKLHDITAQNAKDRVKESEHLSDLYQFKILTEDDWTEFKIRFDKAYPGYINKLRQRFPELAPGDQRQFLLIKLNIDNKECASMLGISADSVKKNRYRLKKKFGLAEEDSLDDFVRSFS